MDYSHLTTYFCWLCDKEADPALTENHYSEPMKVHFCSENCRSMFVGLRNL